MLFRFSPRHGTESSILAGQQNCRSCKISASGMLSARWPVSGAQPPVRSGRRASVKEATARPWSEAEMRTGCLLFTKASQSPTSIPLGIDSPKSPPTRLPPSIVRPPARPREFVLTSAGRAPQDRPRAIPQLLFSAPRTSKSAPRGVQERFIRLWKASFGLPSLFQGLKRPPGRLQEASRAYLAAMLAVFGSNFATHSKRCCHHVGHVSSLKAPSPRALHPRPQARRNARSD